MWRSKTNFILAIYRRAHRLRFTLAGLLALHHQADHAGLNPGHQCRWQAAPGLDPPHPTLQRTSLTSKALDREGGRLAWRPKVDQKRHKVKGKDQTKGQLPPRGNEEDLHQRHVPHGFLQKSDLALAVTARSQRRRGGRAAGLYVHARRVRGLCSQTPPPSPSSRPPSVAARAPGDSGAVSSPALRGWRGRQSGRDLEGGREVAERGSGLGWHGH